MLVMSATRGVFSTASRPALSAAATNMMMSSASVTEPSQEARVAGAEVLVDLGPEGPRDGQPRDKIEQQRQLDRRRDAPGHRQAREVDPVLGDQESHDLEDDRTPHRDDDDPQHD